MKFYELQQINSLHGSSLGFFRKKKDAKEYSRLFNTKVVVKPLKIIEHEFLNIKDFEDEIKKL